MLGDEDRNKFGFIKLESFQGIPGLQFYSFFITDAIDWSFDSLACVQELSQILLVITWIITKLLLHFIWVFNQSEICRVWHIILKDVVEDLLERLVQNLSLSYSTPQSTKHKKHWINLSHQI
jgi:hypothetical protein